MRALLASLALCGVAIAHAASIIPTPTNRRWASDASPFLGLKNGQFVINGSTFRFIGTNAYWLPYLNSEEDISNVLANMSAAGITVVRTWAFNDVTTIPQEGSWLQLIANGTTMINNGTNGLQRLDKVVELAAQHNIYVLFSLTNNWNPIANETDMTMPMSKRADGATPNTTTTQTPLPRNFLSNDFGGMDAYVREFGVTKTHDEFYTNETIRSIFQNYTQAVVSRFVNNPRVLSWELANDARCNSSIPTADTCTTQTVTQWHADVSSFVRSIDPNHLVSSGTQGFLCATCPKLFPLTPPPAPSPAASKRRKRTAAYALTQARQAKRVSEARRRSASPASVNGIRIRGRWVANNNAKRQFGSLGTAFDGSSGVDSQDILNAPNIGFGSFQYFPDQNSYGSINQEPITPALNFSDVLQQGIDWINMQAASAVAVGKPLALTGFGVVTENNAPFFIPFNTTMPAFGNVSVGPAPQSPSITTMPDGVSQPQQNEAYEAWFQAGISAGVSGLMQYQWSAGNLSAVQGTLVQANATNGSSSLAVGTSPNDGYGGLSEQANTQSIFQLAALNITAFLQRSDT